MAEALGLASAVIFLGRSQARSGFCRCSTSSPLSSDTEQIR